MYSNVAGVSVRTDVSLEQWYALYTKARHEKFVERRLLQKGVAAFTPTVALRNRWSDRTKTVHEPLFKNYCFARFRLAEKGPVIGQQGVVTVVHFNHNYIPVAESVICSLQTLIANKVALDPCPYVKVGDKVVIAKGPLKGVEGFVIEKRNNNTTLVISVDAIASSVQCVVTMSDVDRA